MKSCTICGADESKTRIIKRDDVLLCRKHYLQVYRHGTTKRTIYDRNEIQMVGDYAVVKMYDKDGNFAGETKIDIDDIEKCAKYKWHIKVSRNTSYSIATIDEDTKLFLHRLVLDYNGDMDVDHINMDGLDNRKSNLRIVTHSDNTANNSKDGVKKVPSGRWQASICHNYKTIYIGTYNTRAEALSAREACRAEIRG